MLNLDDVKNEDELVVIHSRTGKKVAQEPAKNFKETFKQSKKAIELNKKLKEKEEKDKEKEKERQLKEERDRKLKEEKRLKEEAQKEKDKKLNELRNFFSDIKIGNEKGKITNYLHPAAKEFGIKIKEEGATKNKTHIEIKKEIEEKLGNVDEKSVEFCTNLKINMKRITHQKNQHSHQL
eukprot:Lithocolla_globosa_v1_NODE_121_length_6109_cov_174.362075.p2 type:complete len:180 gc:universal NODE_121_length_6109_cov_174.362075:1196-1735(+)